MILTKKVRLKPTPEQEKQLWKSAGTARWAYNWALAKQEEKYKSGGNFISDGTLRKELTILKQTDEYSWLYDVSNNVTKQAIKDLCEAYKKYFKGLVNHPRFKSKKFSKPSFYNDTAKLKIKNKIVLIEKVGWIKITERIIDSTKYVNPRIGFDGKYWYLTVGIDREFPKQKLTNKSLGIDVGVKDLAVCSNGMSFKNINKTKSIKKIEKRLRRLQRQVSRKYEMNKEGNRYVKTSNIIKLEKQIRLLHRRLTNIRNNHIHQTTNVIAKTKPDTIVMEDLNIKGMLKNRHLAKAIAKQKLNEFIRQMKYKCEKYGIKFIQVGRFYPSSKTCSACGKIKADLKLSDRIYKCSCGLEMDRDLNAAINLAKYGKSVV